MVCQPLYERAGCGAEPCVVPVRQMHRRCHQRRVDRYGDELSRSGECLDRRCPGCLGPGLPTAWLWSRAPILSALDTASGTSKPCCQPHSSTAHERRHRAPSLLGRLHPPHPMLAVRDPAGTGGQHHPFAARTRSVSTAGVRPGWSWCLGCPARYRRRRTPRTPPSCSTKSDPRWSTSTLRPANRGGDTEPDAMHWAHY